MDTRAVITTARKAVQGIATPREMPKVLVQLQVPTGVGVVVHLGSPLDDELVLEDDPLDEPVMGVVAMDANEAGSDCTGGLDECSGR